jgi:hypothetical protein
VVGILFYPIVIHRVSRPERKRIVWKKFYVILLLLFFTDMNEYRMQKYRMVKKIILPIRCFPLVFNTKTIFNAENESVPVLVVMKFSNE